jgi:segregation and condensation protein A
MKFQDVRLQENRTCLIKLNFFEGPLDLLLYLVRKAEVDIKEIKVAEICEQYLAYIEVVDFLNLDLAGEFLLMAATLIRLKANEILPREQMEPVMIDGQPVDRDALIRQIQEYAKYKAAASELKKLEAENLGTFRRGKPDLPEFNYDDFLTMSDAKVFDLVLAFQKIINRKVKKEGFFLDKEAYHIDGQIEWIIGLLADQGKLEFSALFGEEDSRSKMITTFLAVLELVRIGKISIVQSEHFGPIWITQSEGEKSMLEPELNADHPEVVSVMEEIKEAVEIADEHLQERGIRPGSKDVQIIVEYEKPE